MNEPAAEPPTWEDALAHAEVLREQGVKVRVDEGQKWILICGTNGELHDHPDGTPASQGFHPDGTQEWISHWTDGKPVSTETFPPPTGEA